MKSRYPDIVTVSLKRNIQLGVRMEVSTLTCRTYQYMMKKAERPLTLTKMAGRERSKNQIQWQIFSELVSGKPLVVFSIVDLEDFWPSDLLEQYVEKNKRLIIELSETARLFIPGRSFRSLSAMSEFLAGLSQDDSDGKSGDDEILSVFERMVSYIAGLDLRSRADIAAFLAFDHPAVADLLARTSDLVVRRKIPTFRPPDNVHTSVSSEAGDVAVLSDDSIRHVFSADGPAQRFVAGFETRPEQVKFALHFTRSLKREEYFLAEAGTGTGKSLAYLVPALLHYLESGSSVVVSTHTRNLQNQLFYKDLVQAQELVGRAVSNVLLKGRSNYLCLLRMHITRANASHLFDSRQLSELASVLIWKDLTQSGDLSELEGVSVKVRREIECDPGFCPASLCAHYSKCFFFRVRREAAKAKLTVTNHALFFSDLVAESEIFGKPGVVIFDEAHQIERVATDGLTGELSRSSFSTLFAPLESTDPAVPDRLSNLIGLRVRQCDDADLCDAIRETGKKCRELVSEVSRIENIMFTTIERFASERKLIASSYSLRERLTPGHDLLKRVAPALSQLYSALEALSAGLSRLLHGVDSGELIDSEIVESESVQSVARGVASYQTLVANLANHQDTNWVRWLEISPSGWHSMKLAPVEIGDLLNKLVYEKYPRLAMTSATMTVEGDFTFLEERLGLDKVNSDRKRRVSLSSSFDFRTQMRLICTAYLPSPKMDHYGKMLSKFLRQLFRHYERSTMALFTSYQAMESVALDLGHEFPRLVRQDSSDSADRALHEFIRLKPAILFGTESFWQGVDLPGELLEILVITRLPFSVPGDPIDTARMELVEKKGANSFATYSLPAAVIRFKQGFGRLIRTRSDRGVVIVTDNRLVKSNFGQVFLNSVPAEAVIASSWEEVQGAIDGVLSRL
jgi:ATP-dependent DNA helicase DinG